MNLYFNSKSESTDYIGNLLRSYLIDFKYSRLNYSFFTVYYRRCTQKQLDYLFILIQKLGYPLTDSQRKYLSHLSSKECSKIISTLKDIEINIVDTEFDFLRDIEGNPIF